MKTKYTKSLKFLVINESLFWILHVCFNLSSCGISPHYVKVDLEFMTKMKLWKHLEAPKYAF